MNRRKSFSLFLVVVFALLPITTVQVFPQTTGQSARSTTAFQPISIPFEMVNRHVILKIKVNNSRPLSFVLDTGDQYAIINLDVAKELSLTLQGQVQVGGAGSQVSTGAFVKDATFTISGFEGFSQPVSMALPLGNLAPRLGRDFDGIIGSDFIKQFVVEIDYQTRQIRLHNKDKFDYTGLGESIPVALDRAQHPIVEAEVTPTGSEPIKAKFVLDIGSGGALALYSPFVNERKLLSSNMKTIRAMGAGAGGDIAGRVGRVSELKIGKYKIQNPITMFSQDKKGAFASSAIQGNIGAQVLKKFKLFLDYEHNRIIFEPNATFAEPFDRAASGFRLQAEGKGYVTFRIAEVLEDSPASEAGIQPNDIITAIDGKPTRELTLSKLNELFERPVAYELTVSRGEQILKVKLTPRKLV